MDMDKCDKCGKPATVQLTDFRDGQVIEKHLCAECAAVEGVKVSGSLTISELLEDFVLHTSAQEAAELACDVCGLSFNEFRQQKLLGCPHDYDAFEPALLPLLEGAQGGNSQHVGRVPHRAGGEQKKHTALLRLRAELKRAVAAEDYERAAILRDQIGELEST